MRIVVDTNIVFSAILNTESNLSRILLQPRTNLNFYSTNQLIAELNEHKDKLLKISGYSEDELRQCSTIILNKIRIINPALISKTAYEKALRLTGDIDIDDTEFVALTEHAKGKLWSGDKELIRGLSTKKWMKCITTKELLDYLSEKSK